MSARPSLSQGVVTVFKGWSWGWCSWRPPGPREEPVLLESSPEHVHTHLSILIPVLTLEPYAMRLTRVPSTGPHSEGGERPGSIYTETTHSNPALVGSARGSWAPPQPLITWHFAPPELPAAQLGGWAGGRQSWIDVLTLSRAHQGIPALRQCPGVQQDQQPDPGAEVVTKTWSCLLGAGSAPGVMENSTQQKRRERLPLITLPPHGEGHRDEQTNVS